MVMFKPMDEATILEILKGHEDVLTPMVKSDQAVYDAQICPTCGSAMMPEPDIDRLLTGGRPIPKHLSRCPVCTCLIDPFSGLVLEIGNKGNVEPVVPLIHVDD